ncbi:MAG TPA: cobalamin-dependent protein [Casimicrobiaceae bacterium]|nr:cobalamin-dependent protein [Casimicrobiaceae bacterium]
MSEANAAARTRPIKVLLAKPGLDGHDQGAKVVARALIAAGMDVTYTGLRQTPEAVAQAAREADADVIALSSMAGSHLAFCRRLKPLLEAAGLADRLWIIGGNLPRQDHDALRALGFRGVFATGSKLDDITGFIEENVRSTAPEAKQTEAAR